MIQGQRSRLQEKKINVITATKEHEEEKIRELRFTFAPFGI